MKILLAAALLALSPLAAAAQTDQSAPEKQEKDKSMYLPKVHGTIRGKMEYQTNEKESRFEVRTARVSLEGLITPIVNYKAEIDLSDEGSIKMLDAYAGVQPVKDFNLRLGQMRVPFSIDAHRSPHKQYFANRSFIAKQVGNVRDVGFYAGYTTPQVPFTIEAGVFNGSGLTGQKNYWTKEFNFSAKAQYAFDCGLTLEASVQKISPNKVKTYLYDCGATFKSGRFTLEAEYLRKHYSNNAFKNVNAVDAFVCYDQPLRRAFKKISFLCRYDMMNDHSDGTLDDTGALKLTDAERQRVTGGITLSFPTFKGLNADIRLNYEKYFYDDISLAKTSERDKAVVELMVHF